MRQLRMIIDPDDFPDVPDCDGSCAARGGGGAPCVLHAGLCCPDDPIEIIMVHPDIFNEELMKELDAALQQPQRGWAELPPANTTEGDGGRKEVSEDDGGVGCYRDRGGDCSGDGAPWMLVPDAAMSSDSSWTASSLETESSSPPPPPRRLPVLAAMSSDGSSLETESPPPVSRLVVVPRKKRDVSVKRGKRLWSLGIPSIIPASSRSNNPTGVEQDGRHRKKVCGGGGGVRQRLPVARPPTSRQTQRRCTHCDSTETPQWRAGPAGPGTLCNACGIRYTMNKLLPEYRPSTSPSFRSDKHSNRHRKVVKLREKKVKVEKVDNMVALAPDHRGDFEKEVKVEKIIDNMALAPDHDDFMDVCKYM
ncbi:unnamed protein product [Urochloa decumbens]|uniref:GATA-type domain-containing protein n=1 Tax=Urochloa decumbens TaxID=240449 RepID=A0ABC9CQH5_9POAL